MFGPGVGESAAVHVGDGRWLIVDSCRDSRRGDVATLNYLHDCDLDPAECVDWIVATHGHDDHVAGLAETVIACPNAQLVLPAASTIEEFLAFVRIDGRLDFYGTRWRVYSEFSNVIKEVEEGRRTAQLHFATAGMTLPLGTQTVAGDLSLEFLAPSAAAQLRSRQMFGRLLKAAAKPTAGERVLARDPNSFSIALIVHCRGHRFLFGGDLKNGADDWGWSHVLTFLDGGEKIDLFKVAHHGDPKAFHPSLWDSHLSSDCICIVTPYRPSGRPRQDDLVRMCGTGREVFCTATSGSIAASATIRRTKAALSRSRSVEEVGGIEGQVRYRQIDGRDPTIELLGPAFAACTSI